MEAVGEGLRRPVVALVAGAGWGKSTLMALAASRSDASVAWLSLDGAMRAPPLLFAYLAAAIAQPVPGFGAGLDFSDRPEALADAFLRECDQAIDEELVLVLDDAHVLADSAGEAALGWVVAELPPTLHLGLAARWAPGLPLARLRAAGGVLELGERELALTSAETAALLRGQATALSDAEAEDLHRRTEGWPAGVALLSQALGGSLRTETAADRAHLFAYLAEEVYERLPAELREFLLATAVPERVSPELARAVSGSEHAARLLAEVGRRRLFLLRLQGPGEWHRYHQLFREFLLRRLDESGPGARAELEARSGYALARGPDPAEAVPHLLAAGEIEAAVDVLEPIAEQLATSPSAPQLGEWLERVPRERWAERPGLLLAAAQLRFATGDFGSAFEALERAIDRLIELGDHDRAAAGCFFLVQAFGTAGGGGQGRAITAASGRLDRLDPSTELLPLARVILAQMYAYADRPAEARAELERALALPGARTPWLEAYAAAARAFWITLPDGAVQRALGDLETAIAQLRVHEAADRLAALPYALGWHAWMLCELGRDAESLAAARRALDVAERRGLGGAFGPLMMLVASEALPRLGRWAELEAELDRTASWFEAGPGGGYRFAYDSGLAWLAARRRDHEAAAALIASARASSRRNASGDPHVAMLCRLAEVAEEATLPELAADLAAEAMSAAERAGPWAQTRATLLAAATIDDATAEARLVRCLALTAEWGYTELWTRKERHRAAALLARSLASGLGPPGEAERLLAACGADVMADAADRLRSAGAEARAALARAAGRADDADIALVTRLIRDPDTAVRRAARAAETALARRPRPRLRITTLGGLTIRRGEHLLSERSFGRQKARALFACLVAARSPVHRERLVEWLWPELGPSRGLAALHTALYELRRALEPGLTRGVPSSLVVTDDQSYRLALRAGDDLDARRLLELAGRPPGTETLEAEIVRLEAALALYGGEFLPEWPYAPWAEEPRRELSAAHEAVLADLGDALIRAGRPRDALTPLRRLVAHEPQAEGPRRTLMRALAGAGEPTLALREYHLLRARLRREHGAEPAEETRELYARLLARTV